MSEKSIYDVPLVPDWILDPPNKVSYMGSKTDTWERSQIAQEVRAYLTAKKGSSMAYWDIFQRFYKGRGLRITRNVRTGGLERYSFESWGTSTPVTPQKLLADLEQSLGIGFNISPAQYDRWLSRMLEGEQYDPAQHYLESLTRSKPQGHGRPEIPPVTPVTLEDMGKLFKGDHRDLYQTYLIRWLISAVARVYRPGCKADHVLVLRGKQGIGKSTMLSILFGDLFSELHSFVKGDERTRIRNANWGLELGEIGSTFRSHDIDALKAEITATHDTYRKLYKEDLTKIPRRCVYAASTNEETFLNDPTGNRRFWVIDLGSEPIDTDWIKANRDGIWALALQLFMDKEPWHLTEQEAAMSGAITPAFEVSNPYTDELARVLIAIKENEAILPNDLMTVMGLARSDMKGAKAVSAAMSTLGYQRTRITLDGHRGYYYVKPGLESYTEARKSALLAYQAGG